MVLCVFGCLSDWLFGYLLLRVAVCADCVLIY